MIRRDGSNYFAIAGLSLTLTKGKTIAIDGPVASGKTSVGRVVSLRLGYSFLDTGVMYRAMTWLALKREIPLDREEELVKLAKGTDIQVNLEPPPVETVPEVWLDGLSVSEELHNALVGEGTSILAQWRQVREVMVARQRKIASKGNIVMVGRDIGTVVLPQADLKVFLQGSSEIRASRRYKQLMERGEKVSFQEVLDEIEERDRRDSQRAASPLRPADDAYLLNTDKLTLEQVVQHIIDMVLKSQR